MSSMKPIWKPSDTNDIVQTMDKVKKIISIVNQEFPTHGHGTNSKEFYLDWLKIIHLRPGRIKTS